MALFSLCGLTLLLVAGPAIEQRMTRRMQRATTVLENSETNSAVVENPESEGPLQPAYSLGILRWILAVAAAAGIAWSLWPHAESDESEETKTPNTTTGEL